MIKISDILENLILNNSLFTFWMKKGILNLSQLAELFHPIVEEKTKKEVSKQSLVMQLSRMQKVISKQNPKNIEFLVKNISIISWLATFSFKKNIEIQKKLFEIKQEIEGKWWFFSFNETTSEITVIYDFRFSDSFNNFKDINIYEHREISGIKLNFSQEDFDTPWLLSFLLDKFSISWINIIELSSSFTEIIFYIDKKDTKSAFEMLYT